MQGFHSHRANLGFRHAAEKVDNDHFVFVLCNIAVIKRIEKKIEREYCRAFIVFFAMHYMHFNWSSLFAKVPRSHQ